MVNLLSVEEWTVYSIETVRVHYDTSAVQKPPPACPILVYQFRR